MQIVRHAVKALLPYGVVQLYRRLQKPSSAASAEREQFHQRRYGKIAEAARLDNGGTEINPFDFDALVAFHEKRGLLRHHLLEGSIPCASLQFVRQAVEQHIGTGPLLGLHVGNYVGISLAFCAAALKAVHPESRMLGIDPNVPHRGTADPQSHVAALLRACDLQDHVLILTGYSGRKSISNDGVEFDGYDPVCYARSESAVEHVLRSLGFLLPQRINFALIDGNHEADYVRAELCDLAPLLARNALVVLDDVDAAWQELRDVFNTIDDSGFAKVGTDGRVGVLRFVS